MRRALNVFYAATAGLAAAATVLIVLVVFIQVGARLLGVGVRGADDLVAWLTATACLSGIGYAFTQNSHVRVDLVVNHLAARWHRPAAVLATAAGCAISGYAAYACVLMVLESHAMGELSQGDIPVRIWIPQLGVAIGAVSLAVVLADALWALLRGVAAQAVQPQPKSPLAEV